MALFWNEEVCIVEDSVKGEAVAVFVVPEEEDEWVYDSWWGRNVLKRTVRRQYRWEQKGKGGQSVEKISCYR